VCLGVSLLIVLPLALKTPKHHFTVAARVGGDLLVWIGLAAGLRFVAFLVETLRGPRG
jgi:hypothetical protein